MESSTILSVLIRRRFEIVATKVERPSFLEPADNRRRQTTPQGDALLEAFANLQMCLSIDA